MRKLFYLLLTISVFISSAQSLREIYQEGLKAYEEKNYELFREKMYTIDTMRPNYPAVVYNLAGAYALTGQTEMSIKTLNKYILMDATQDFTQDTDFSSIAALDGFKVIQEKQKKLTGTIDIKQIQKYPVLQSHPESITYSEKQNAFFIGGVRDGNIWKLAEGSEPAIWAESSKNSWAVMGLEVSPDEKILWACTSSMTNYTDYKQTEEGFASVLKYDLKTGKLLETFTESGGHNFGDLISDDKGNIYISDGTANKLYWISSKEGKMEVFMDFSKTVFNLQGLTFDDTRENIYLSDYIDGIYKLNLASKSVIKLKIEADEILIKGIDGLYYVDGELIGLHNGTNPNRIIKYQLSDDGNSITGKEVLAQGGQLGEPTQGVWIKNKFYFIVNSPWAAYDKDGNFNPKDEFIVLGSID